jgi:hypothetical protein
MVSRLAKVIGTPALASRACVAALALGLAALVVTLAWRSRGWPLIHDAAVMHYIAWLLDTGAVPYRDVFDMNTPGAYLVHLGLLKTLGDSDVAWRLLDLGWLTLTCAVMARYLWPLGTSAAIVSSLLFAAYHLAGGPWLAGQRDFLLCPFVVAAAALVSPRRGMSSSPGADPASGTIAPVVSGAIARHAAAGLTAGVAVILKPPALIFLILLALAVATAPSRTRHPSGVSGPQTRGRGPQLFALLAGGAVVPLACATWLAATGGLGPSAQMFGEYVLPLYSRLARVWPWTALGWWPFGWRVWGLLGVLIGLATVAGWRPAIADAGRRPPRLATAGRRPPEPTNAEWRHRWRLIVAGLAYGAFHFAIQGKGWEYQLYPLALFACLAGGLTLATSPRAIRYSAAGAVALLTVTLAAKGAQEAAPPWIAEKAARVERLVADLERQLGPGDRVQVLDTNGGGVHALLRLRLHQPTRFVYDFHFLHDEDQPAILALRAELVAALAAEPPAVIVILKEGWPAGGYERFERFPELVRWLDAHYEIARDAGDYRLYASRTGSEMIGPLSSEWTLSADAR